MKKSFTIIIIILIIGTAGASYYLFYKNQRFQKESVPSAVEILQFERSQQIAPGAAGGTQAMQAATQEKIQVPAELNLKMTFYSQAPFGDWSEPWQEACEEASILLIADTYYRHNWTRENFRDEILKLVTWEDQNFGDYRNTNTAQISRMLQEYLGLKSVIHPDPSFEDVQQVLARGHLIVMTFAGKMIGNPNYKNGGPVYHAMVMKGYKTGAATGAADKVITEDVGTKNGEDYVYNWATLQRALHDYTEPIENGKKLMIEVLPPDNL